MLRSIDNILALDLGTKIGICYGYADFAIPPRVETLQLGKPSEVKKWSSAGLLRSCDPRVERLFNHLQTRYLGVVDHIVFEDVVFASTTYQAQLWASFRAALWLAFSKVNVSFHPVPVGTLKKYATGSGAADKESMLRSAVKTGLDCSNLDDNAIDAFWLWRWGVENI